MKYLIIIIGFLSITSNSCHKSGLENKIGGVWIFDNMVNLQYLDDTTDFFKQRYPMIYDFQNDGKLVVKVYGKLDTTFTWELKPDSILKLDRLNYKVLEVGQSILSLIDSNSNDNFKLTFNRPENTNIKLEKSEVEGILLSHKWKSENFEKQKLKTQFYYFNNGAMILRYKSFDRNIGDSVDQLQLEMWGIAKYDEFLFLYNYVDWMLGNGNINKINQIIEIDSSSYTVSNFYRKNNRAKYVVDENKKKQITHRGIKGKWISKNDKNNTYGKLLPFRFIEEGGIDYFEGDLFLTINDSKLIFQIKGLNPWEYNWKLSDDARTLVLDYTINEPEIHGKKYKYIDVLELNDRKLKIRLFDNNYFTEKEKPYSYLLNLIQEFDRIE